MPKEGVGVRLVEAALPGRNESGLGQLCHISLDLAGRAAQISPQRLAGREAHAVGTSVPGESGPEELRAARKTAVGQDHVWDKTTGAELAVWDELLARNQ